MNPTLTTRRQTTGQSWLNRIGPVLLAIPLVGFTAFLLAYAVNVPWMDDIDAFLNFIVGYTDAQTFSDKLSWLLRPNNEHRILIAKLITLGMYNLTGEVNFRGLILLAFVFLLGILYLFYHVFRSFRLPLLAFAPVGFLLLQPQHYLTSIWAITGLQHQVVVCLTFTAMYLLAAGGRGRFVGATGLQLLASLSMSNGLFGWVAGAVVLALQRHWRRLGAWLVVGVATIIFYFHDFQSPQGNESSFSFFLKYPYLVFSGFFTFTGALFDFFPDSTIFWRSVLPTLAGLLLIGLLLWMLWRMNEPLLRHPASRLDGWDSAAVSMKKRRYFFTGCYAFLMVNAVIVAFLRPRMGYGVMLVSNYMLYPAVLVILLYLNVISEFAARRDVMRWVQLGLTISLIVWGVSYGVRWPKVAYRKQQLLTNAFNQKHNDTGLGATWGTPFAEVAARTMRQTVQRGMYHYPDQAYYTPYESLLTVPGRPTGTEAMSISGGGYSYIAETNRADIPVEAGPSAVVVQSEQRTYLFVSEAPYTLTNFWLNRTSTPIRAEIVNSMLAPGTYRVGVLTPANSAQPLRFSTQQIAIP
ncbi:hypothetical protein HNV11_04525 [Spirosoma taeanense]|uniref:Glycosyltransferase RgtA/B/C/D-like domain-containing protein n=1 Tax=Spirosoma taeanense TaxID=2735870 RepID=A0A6M5Y6L2_9BACT|nr:hypothetical protein [Spirosoma taeanense]QJW88693.1 hypothetical protein HNV11_04525 [Spirosoma taeanense]